MQFRGDFYFLSNMYPCKVTIDGITYSSAEAAYQAAKTDDIAIKQVISKLDGYSAKRFGKTITLVPTWKFIKVAVMTKVVVAKFKQNKNLAHKLIATGDTVIIEENTWNDTFWGMCNGFGSNRLGEILMYVRKHLNKLRREKMKKEYIVNYIPLGCSNDEEKSFDSLKEAVAFCHILVEESEDTCPHLYVYGEDEELDWKNI